MFGGSTIGGIERGFGWLERIIDIIVRLLGALSGGSNSTTTGTTEQAD